jgi:glycosyltransferase involved in cell wall biosynthesis
MKLLFKIKILLQLQGEVFNYPAETHGWLKRKLSFMISKIVSHFSDRIRCVSKAIYLQALEAGISATKLAYSPARCNTDLFDPGNTKEERVNIRRTHGFSKNNVLITVSSLVPDKGMREFLQAFIDLHQDYPDLRAMIVGDGPLKGELQKRVVEKNLDTKVAFCGYVAHSSIPGYLSAGDVFVLPTKHEGMGRAILEAMAMELPVLASAVGGIPEIISDGVTGILLENGTPEEIADNVALLLSDKKYRRELGREARQYVIENHEFETTAEYLVQMHYEL